MNESTSESDPSSSSSEWILGSRSVFGQVWVRVRIVGSDVDSLLPGVRSRVAFPASLAFFLEENYIRGMKIHVELRNCTSPVAFYVTVHDFSLSYRGACKIINCLNRKENRS
jgi:hypothetical protein